MSNALGALEKALAGRYRLERELGEGGMAMVYLAEEVKHQRQVAIKVLKPDLVGGVAADRFHLEIEIAANLQHPQIVQLLDSGTAAGLHYYVMPFVEGESLQDRLSRESPLPIEEAVRITRQVGRALAYAHEQGVVHRDIKPANILLTSGGALVADFGVAAALNAANAERLTQPGIAVGTPSYMSPEQSGAEATDGRADQYSLACVAYEMLAGDPPFTGKAAHVLMSRHLLDPVPPLSSARASVPIGVEEAITRALEKMPADRYPSMGEFLSAIHHGETTETRLTAGRRAAVVPSRRRVPPLVWLGVAAAGISGVVFLWPAPTAPPLDPTNVAVLYFDDHSPTGSLGYLADGLTEALITELAEVGPLDVVTRNGVKPFRDLTIPLDSLARLLNVGSIVGGTVEQKGDSLIANISLTDANTSFSRSSQRVARAGVDLIALRDEIVVEAKRLLSREVGTSIQLEAARAATRSDEAWSSVQRAARLRQQAEELRWGRDDRAAAADQLTEADALLALAEEQDPDWIEPIIARGWVASDRARLASTGSRSSWDEPSFREAIAHAERALERQPAAAAGLELRGTVLYDLTWLSELATDTSEVNRLRQAAESDLRAAVRTDSTRARAYVALAQLQRTGGQFAQASESAQRALEADPFLINAESFILFAMAQAWLDMREMDLAIAWNEEAMRRYPIQAQFHATNLVMMAGWPGWERAVDTAWAVASHPGLQNWRPRRLLVAAVLAREGLADSAKALIAQVRSEGHPDPMLHYYEAEARMQLGEPDAALELLGQFLEARPGRKPYIAEDWWWETLRDHPEFRALVRTD